MKLKIYKRSGYHRGPYGKVGTISIHRQGRTAVNSVLLQSLGLKRGDKMQMAQDTDSRNDWYLSFGDAESEGYVLTPASKERPGKGLTAYYNMEAVETILASVKAETSVTFLVGTENPVEQEGRTWYRILTANPLRIK